MTEDKYNNLDSDLEDIVWSTFRQQFTFYYYYYILLIPREIRTASNPFIGSEHTHTHARTHAHAHAHIHLHSPGL